MVAILSSIRYTEDSAPTRLWIFGTGTKFGVVAFSCYVDDSRFEAVRPVWKDLATGIGLPKN